MANTRAVLRLAFRSRGTLAALRVRYPGLRFTHSESGKVHIYDSRGKFEAAKAALEFKSRLGCRQQTLTVDELCALEPAFP